MIVSGPEHYQRIADWLLERLGPGRKIHNYTAIGLERRGKLVAGVVYHDFSGDNICAGIAGEGKHWMTPEFLWFMFYYPFIQCNVKTITAYVERANIASQRFVEKLGFEFIYPKEHEGRQFRIYQMKRENCRHLERRHAGNTQETRITRQPPATPRLQ